MGRVPFLSRNDSLTVYDDKWVLGKEFAKKALGAHRFKEDRVKRWMRIFYHQAAQQLCWPIFGFELAERESLLNSD